MPKYVALLRGVSPMNAKMPELKKAFEKAGFTGVKTLLSSGNVVFDAPTTPVATLERKAMLAMAAHLGKSFLTIVRPVNGLKRLLSENPYERFDVPAGWKRDVTFLSSRPNAALKLPMRFDGSCIYAIRGGAAFSAHLPNHPKGAVFMQVLEKTFGKEITTRTWDTATKITKA